MRDKTIIAVGIIFLIILYTLSLLSSKPLPYKTWESLSSKNSGTLIDISGKEAGQEKFKFSKTIKAEFSDFYKQGNSLLGLQKSNFDSLPKPILILSREEDQSRLLVSVFNQAGVDSVFFIRGGLTSLLNLEE